MWNNYIKTILEISVSMAVVIAAALTISAALSKSHSAKGRYILWLILAVRLIIPFSFKLPQPPVTITAPRSDYSVVLRTDSTLPLQIMDNEEAAQKGAEQANSANYAPVLSLEQLVAIIYLFGAAVFVLVHLISYLRFCIQLRGKTEYAGEYSGLKYYTCPVIQSPVMYGFFRPKVLVPDENFTPEETEIILAHEYTHFRRGDLWYKLLLMLANAVHWFNPLVYVMVRRAGTDLEFSCDEAVIKGKPPEFRRQYSFTILKTMRRKSEPYLTAHLSQEEQL